VRAVPRLCEFYPGICPTTEQKARKNLSQGKKNLSQGKKNLSQSTVYILPNTHTLQNPHKHTINHLTPYKFVLLYRQLRNISIQNRGNRIVFELLMFNL